MHSPLTYSQHQYEELNEPALQSCMKSLEVNLSMLAQLLASFCQCYEGELQPWVGHQPAPILGPLGPLCKRTATHWTHISKVVHYSPLTHWTHIGKVIIMWRDTVGWRQLCPAMFEIPGLPWEGEVLHSQRNVVKGSKRSSPYFTPHEGKC